MINYCPLPRQWNDIYIALKKAWLGKLAEQPKLKHPPFPLILDHWAGSSDSEKFARWEATLEWANSMGVADLIPELAPMDCYPAAHTTLLQSPFEERRQTA